VLQYVVLKLIHNSERQTDVPRLPIPPDFGKWKERRWAASLRHSM
jgi:hypothetical protein